MTDEQALKYAKTIAWCVAHSHDPELYSIANSSCARALRSFDPNNGTPLKRWIARLVRIDIYDYWRRQARRKEEFHTGEWWAEAAIVEPQEQELLVSAEDWQLLYDKYVENWPFDVVARRHGYQSTYAGKKAIREAEARFIAAYGDTDFTKGRKLVIPSELD